jgi:hypothetical protein
MKKYFFFFWTFINPQELLEVTTKFSLNRADYQMAVSVSDTMLIRKITIFRSHLQHNSTNQFSAKMFHKLMDWNWMLTGPFVLLKD